MCSVRLRTHVREIAYRSHPAPRGRRPPGLGVLRRGIRCGRPRAELPREARRYPVVDRRADVRRRSAGGCLGAARAQRARLDDDRARSGSRRSDVEAGIRPGLRSAPVDLDLVFLGTSASAPTAARGTAATLIRRGGDRLLVDCGEGTQRQLLRSDVGLVDLEHVFLTHFHADHYLGLPGMLKTFALRGRELPVTVYGPPGLKDLFATLRRVFGTLTYEVGLVEVRPGDVVARDDYVIRAFGVDHGTQAVGYALVESP